MFSGDVFLQDLTRLTTAEPSLAPASLPFPHQIINQNKKSVMDKNVTKGDRGSKNMFSHLQGLKLLVICRLTYIADDLCSEHSKKCGFLRRWPS